LLHLVYHTFVLPIWASSFLTIASTHDCGEAKWRKAGLSAACMARDGYSIHLSPLFPKWKWNRPLTRLLSFGSDVSTYALAAFIARPHVEKKRKTQIAKTDGQTDVYLVWRARPKLRQVDPHQCLFLCQGQLLLHYPLSSFAASTWSAAILLLNCFFFRPHLKVLLVCCARHRI
jgi:hypothetical protein